MTSYYIDQGKAQYDLESFGTGPWYLRIEEVPEKITIAPGSSFGVEDIFLGYSYDGDTGPLWVTVNFLGKDSFEGYIKALKSSSYLSQSKEVWKKVPSYYSYFKNPRTYFENQEEINSLGLDAIKEAGLTLAEVQQQVVQFFSNPYAGMLFNAVGGGGGSIRFLSDDSSKIADSIISAYPGYEARRLYKDDLGLDVGAIDFIYFRQSSKTVPRAETSTQQQKLSSPDVFGINSADVITNYRPKSDDPILIELGTFEGANGSLKICKKTKQVAKIAKSETDFIYDQQAGYLYYNENGKEAGFGSGGIFAVLEGKPKIALGNFDFT
jgi:hypothetical protein